MELEQAIRISKIICQADEERLMIPVRQFNAYCAERKLRPLLVKRFLARHGYLMPTYEGEKRMYTTPARGACKRGTDTD